MVFRTPARHASYRPYPNLQTHYVTVTRRHTEGEGARRGREIVMRTRQDKTKHRQEKQMQSGKEKAIQTVGQSVGSRIVRAETDTVDIIRVPLAQNNRPDAQIAGAPLTLL